MMRGISPQHRSWWLRYCPPGQINERRDKEAKLKLYSVQGVHDYWVVNWQTQTVEVYRRQEAVLKLTATLYYSDELTSPILPNFRCLVSQFFV
jgi:transcriptional regulator of nitric oxide reductase